MILKKIFFSFIILSQSILANSIFYTRGLVALEREGKLYKVKKGVPLKTDDIIKTGPKAIAIIQYGNKSKLKLDPNSLLKFKDFYKDGNPKKKTSLLSLIKGNLIMDYQRDKQSKNVYIEVKHVAVGVRGTRFLISSESKNDSNAYVAVKNGKVNVYNYASNDYESIGRGKAIVIEEGKKLTKPYKFQWVNSLNWDLTEKASSTLFNTSEIKKLRNNEVGKLIKNLRLRKPRKISNSVIKKWNKIQTDSLKFKSPLKSIKNKVKKRRKRIKKTIKKKTKNKLKNKINNKNIKEGLKDFL